MKQLGRKACVSLSVLGLLSGTAEVAFRHSEPRWIADVRAFEELRRFVYAGLPASRFEPRPHTVFGRPRGARRINDLGFDGGEWQLAKTPGVPRIICLGSSTTERGHPDFLEGLLEERTGRDFEVYNAGISGWTTAETLVSYFLLVQDFQADLIVLHDAINDVGPRAVPGYRSDYTHYRHHWDPVRFPAWQRALVRASHLYSWLFLGGKAPTVAQFTTRQLRPGESTFDGRSFPPGTDFAYRRNLCTIADHARSHGAEILVLTMPLRPAPTQIHREQNANFYRGVAEFNAIVRELAAGRGWLLADAEQAFQRREGGLAEHFLDIAHLDEQGNRFKAELIADVLVERWLPTLGPGRPVPGR